MPPAAGVLIGAVATTLGAAFIVGIEVALVLGLTGLAVGTVSSIPAPGTVAPDECQSTEEAGGDGVMVVNAAASK